MSKNWKGPIGPVTVKNVQGDTWVFPSLVEALKARIHRYHRIVEQLPERMLFQNCYISTVDRSCIVILDECGIPVPAWRVEQDLQDIDLPPLFTWNRGPCAYVHERDFRNGPIPGRGRRRMGRFYRHMKTRQELGYLEGLEADMQDAEDFPVRVKIRGRRRNLPTLWDDRIMSRRGDSWKNYRKTQYKQKS